MATITSNIPPPPEETYTLELSRDELAVLTVVLGKTAKPVNPNSTSKDYWHTVGNLYTVMSNALVDAGYTLNSFGMFGFDVGAIPIRSDAEAIVIGR